MQNNELLNTFDQEVRDESVTIPEHNTYTDRQISFINCYVRAWYASMTELSYENVGKMKRRPVPPTKEELKLYFKYEATILDRALRRFDVKYLRRFHPDEVVDDNENHYEHKPDSFDTDEEWHDISEKIREKAMYIVLKKIADLRDVAHKNEIIIKRTL